MTDECIARIRAFLMDCSDVYGIGDVDEDLEAGALTAETLSTPSAQKKFAHMRLAREVALWRTLRARLGPSVGPVVPVQAGPCFSVLGWFLDTVSRNPVIVQTHDDLDWLPLRDLPSHRALLTEILGDQAHIEHHTGPDLPSALPGDATVMLSFALQRHPDERRLFAWLRDVAPRVQRIVLADVRHDRDPSQWQRVRAGLQIADPPCLFRAAGIGDFANAYPQRAAWGFRRTRDHLSLSTVLLGDAAGWRFLDGSSS